METKILTIFIVSPTPLHFILLLQRQRFRGCEFLQLRTFHPFVVPKNKFFARRNTLELRKIQTFPHVWPRKAPESLLIPEFWCFRSIAWLKMNQNKTFLANKMNFFIKMEPQMNNDNYFTYLGENI